MIVIVKYQSFFYESASPKVRTARVNSCHRCTTQIGLQNCIDMIVSCRTV